MCKFTFLSAIDIRDVLGLAGFVCLEWGVALWSIPAALIVAGMLLCAVAVWPVLRRRTP